MEAVRASAAWVSSRSSHVKVDLLLEIEKVVDKIQGDVPKVEWDFEGIHYFDNGPLTVQYLFVLDALNFCFWPDKDLSYDNLASGLKLALEKDKTALDADRLQNYTGIVSALSMVLFSSSVVLRTSVCKEAITSSKYLLSWKEMQLLQYVGVGPELRQLLNWPRPLPIEEERVRLLHEVGLELERSFGGEAANLVKSAGNSAASLIELITRHFPVAAHRPPRSGSAKACGPPRKGPGVRRVREAPLRRVSEGPEAPLRGPEWVPKGPRSSTAKGPEGSETPRIAGGCLKPPGGPKALRARETHCPSAGGLQSRWTRRTRLVDHDQEGPPKTKGYV